MSVVIDYDLCESSGCCETVCPEDVFKRENKETKVVKPFACTHCWICVDHCATGAIEID